MAVTIRSFLSTAGNPDVYYNDQPKGVTYLSITDMTLPYDFVGLTAVVYNNEIHVIGGNNAATGNISYHLKWDGTQWVAVSTLPVAFVDGRAIVFDNEIHLFNGITHYAFDGSAWVEKAMPSDMDATGASVVVFQDRMHFLGGANNLKAHYMYNGTRWVSTSTLDRNFNKGSAIAYGDALHIFGGNLGTHYKWDGSTWEQVASSAPTYANGSAVIYDDSIYFIGSGAYVYDGTSWKSKSGVLFSPTYCAAVSHKGRVYYMGYSTNVRRFCLELGSTLASNYSIQ